MKTVSTSLGTDLPLSARKCYNNKDLKHNTFPEFNVWTDTPKSATLAADMNTRRIILIKAPRLWVFPQTEEWGSPHHKEWDAKMNISGIKRVESTSDWCIRPQIMAHEAMPIPSLALEAPTPETLEGIQLTLFIRFMVGNIVCIKIGSWEEIKIPKQRIQ